MSVVAGKAARGDRATNAIASKLVISRFRIPFTSFGNQGTSDQSPLFCRGFFLLNLSI